MSGIRSGFCCGLSLLVAAATFAEDSVQGERALHLEPAFRRPSSAVLLNEGTLLAIANRRSGSVTLVDAITGAIQSETKIGQEISDLAALPRSSKLALTDFARHELIFVDVDESSLKVDESSLKTVRRIPVARYPVTVEAAPDGTVCAVASLWSRRISLVTLDGRKVEPLVIDLPFAPLCLAFAGDGTLIISEAFGGRIASLQAGESTPHIYELPVHNIRDLAIRDDRVWLTHQFLRETARTESEHIHWGVLLENLVSSIDLESLRARSADTEKVSPQLEKVRIGDAGDGAGDPSGIAVMSDRLAVTLAGTAQLALIDRVGVREVRLPAAARPVRVQCDESRQRAYVVNSIGESITLIDLKKPSIIRTVPLGPTPAPRPFDRGEAAFYNARLSLENWMSCHSCHTDGHTGNRLADTLGDGDYGNAKRIPTLLGTAGTGPWAWTGSRKTLSGQLRKSLETTMHSRPLSGRDVNDLVVYLQSLRPAPSLAAARAARDSASSGDTALTSVKAGRAVFESAGCAECHSGSQYTAEAVFDVGLEDQLGLRQFNPPSLRGVSQRDRLLHDGRVESLDRLLDIHPPRNTLSPEERRQLIAFLNSL